MAAPPIHPVRLDGRLEPRLSRWLWLVKWLLAIPHFIVLAFLWLAFAVVTVVAFFAILFTGRYPRGCSTSTSASCAGRGGWRFYSYAALGTDRYPPFTLGERRLPGDLDVAYPERLSRGLVLVKWWLLAIPQYLIVGLFVGGGWLGGAGTRATVGLGRRLRGLIGLLVLFAGRGPALHGALPAGALRLRPGS